ncbi:threonine/serine exporter family protein, partial [Kocuria rhizophila]
MSVNEQLRHLAHQGYPSSGEATARPSADDQPFGPGGDTALREAVRSTAPRRRARPMPRPTEEQAAQARARAAAHPHTDPHAAAPRTAGPRTL